MMKTPIRLMIADDHALFRDGLKSMLGRQRDMQVVAEVEGAGALKNTLAETPCDILLLDLQMDRWTLSDVGRIREGDQGVGPHRERKPGKCDRCNEAGSAGRGPETLRGPHPD